MVRVTNVPFGEGPRRGGFCEDDLALIFNTAIRIVRTGPRVAEITYSNHLEAYAAVCRNHNRVRHGRRMKCTRMFF